MTKTTSIHDQIVTYLTDTYGVGVDMRPRDLFYNTNGKGLRLTRLGYELLQHDFDCYPYPIEKAIKVKVKHILALDAEMQWPYYLSSKQIVLFSEDDSVIMKLVGGYENWIASVSS